MTRALLIAKITALALLASAQEPTLPAGLEAFDEPALPSGLEDLDSPAEESQVAPNRDEPRLHTRLRGFTELRAGVWTRSNPVEPDLPLAEARAQADLGGDYRGVTFQLTADLVADFEAPRHDLDLRRGEGWLDLREAWLGGSPMDWLDLRLGRQISTWGTGDYLFINDLFPKDWQSFLLGRDDAYLKAPGDALRASLFTHLVNAEVIYTPVFAPDRFITGERLSIFDAASGRIEGEDRPVNADIPDGGELALRLYRLIGDMELAAYAYHGYWKSPAGQTPDGRAAFPGLNVLGASARKPILGGIAKVEVGYYHSRDDPSGTDPRTRNSEWRALVGYEREVARELTASVQAYAEQMRHHPAYRRSLPPGTPARDETRLLFSLRLTQQLLRQDLTLSLFAFYSPTDADAYLRPSASYKLNDRWQATAGANLFYGSDAHTFFGQFQRNDSLYASLRASF